MLPTAKRKERGVLEKVMDVKSITLAATELAA